MKDDDHNIDADRAAGRLVDLRMPPVNLESEQALLGHMLRGAACPDFLGQQHFADPIHGLIHSAIERHRLRRQRVDLASIAAHFQRTGELAEVGGTAYLGHLYGGLGVYTPGASISPSEHARLIHDAWVRRLQCGNALPLRPPPSAGAGALQ